MTPLGGTAPAVAELAGGALAGVALAAGLGERLRPLTDLRPKALCPVNEVPLLDLALARLAAQTGAGPAHLAVNAHHLAQQIADHVGRRAHLSLERAEPLGTAGALGLLRPWIEGRHVLVTNSDTYLPGGLGDLVSGFDGERCRLLVRELPAARQGDFRHGGRPVDYVGACLLPWALVRRLQATPSGLYEVLWRDLDQRGELDLVVTAAPAIDCGTPRDYLGANLQASGGRNVIGKGATVEGSLVRCVVWDGAHVGPHEQLADVVRAGDRHHPVTVSAC